MHKYILFIIISVCVGLVSCESETITPEETPGEVSFSKNVLPIFNANCINCHAAGGPAPDLQTNPYQTLTTGGYINTAEPANSSLYTKLHSPTSTHAGRASAQQQNIILKWIELGAKND